MKTLLIVLLLLTCSLAFSQQAINGNRYILGYWNASGATWTMPFKVDTTQPVTCTVGEVMFDSDAAAGQNIFVCSATDVWTQLTTGSGSGDMAKSTYDINNDGTVGRADQAVSLTADGTNCSAGQAPLGVDASGNAQSCFTPAGGATPAGVAGNVQYNGDGTNLGAEAAFNYDATNNELVVGTVTPQITCILGGTAPAGVGSNAICVDPTYGLMCNFSGTWLACSGLQNNAGHVPYAGTNYELASEAGFSYADSTNILTVATIKPTTSIRGNSSNLIPFDPDSDGTAESSLDASGNFSANAATATALAANGANCTAGQIPLGVDASGAAEGCYSKTTRRTIGVAVDGGVDTPTTGIKGTVRVPMSGTIKKYSLMSDASGSISFGVWKDTFANYPPTSGDSICASACPSLSSSDHAEDSTLTGWTVAVTAGDVFRFNLNSVSTIKWATLIIEIEETL